MLGNRVRLRVFAAVVVVPLALSVTAAASSASAAAAPRSWRITDLGQGDNSVAMAINDRGHVVGIRADGEAFLWRAGRTVDLGAFVPTDVNNRDEVTGYRFDGTGPRAVFWRGGKRIDLRTPLGGQSYAGAVNDRSEVVGWISAADGPLRASAWHGGALTVLGTGVATDVNDRGQVVGSTGDTEQFAVRWWHGTQVRLTDEPSQAVAVNRSGTVTGRLWGPSGIAGFVWQRGRFVALPPPPGEADFRFLQPTGINGRTQVVGTSSDGAFVWERGRMTILPGLTRASEANDINERGVIAGADPTTADGLRPHAVIWRR